MGWDRAEHMAVLVRDIKKWEAQASDTDGKGETAKKIRPLA